ncbi:SMP-30/gluconolactonase/LRE family protein, partial [Sinomonas humi]
WGLGEVRRYSPDGELTESVSVPAPHTSSVVFAGPELDTLVITTATQDLTDAQLAEYPASGRLFTARPGVHGLPQPLWSGLPLPPTNPVRNE